MSSQPLDVWLNGLHDRLALICTYPDETHRRHVARQITQEIADRVDEARRMLELVNELTEAERVGVKVRKKQRLCNRASLEARGDLERIVAEFSARQKESNQ